MKVLKDVNQVLQILMEKKFQLCKKFREAEGDEASRISGQENSIGCVRGHIRYVMSDHRGFDGGRYGGHLRICSQCQEGCP